MDRKTCSASTQFRVVLSWQERLDIILRYTTKSDANLGPGITFSDTQDEPSTRGMEPWHTSFDPSRVVVIQVYAQPQPWNCSGFKSQPTFKLVSTSTG
mmetsp:Transcript_16018/g.23584  ORF Transcript_16018/g.23584 Transcript_16018/m.23584 type:complete len:98 (-) Transcript_16018:44-337(-)